ncbi:MAG: PKD domain-containing protein [Telluria sp.]
MPAAISPKKIGSLVRDALISRVFEHLLGPYSACWGGGAPPLACHAARDGWPRNCSLIVRIGGEMSNEIGRSVVKRHWRGCLVSLWGSALLGCGGSGSAPATPDNTVLAATVSAHAATPATPAPGVAAELTAEAAAHRRRTTYSIVNLGSGPLSAIPSINSKDQVAFSLFNASGNSRGGFFDGATVRAIGTLGGAQSFAPALNDSGQVAGYSDLASGIFHPFRWSIATGMLDLGTLNGAPASFGQDINGPGHVVGYNDIPLSAPQAFFWSDTTGMVDLGRLGAGLGSAVAQVINDAGTVAGYSDTLDSSTHAFMWTAAGGMTDLGTIGGIDSYARLINNAGQIAGYSAVNDANGFYYHGFVWNQASGMVDIGTLSGLGSVALAMNQAGQIAGASDINSLYQHAISWTQAGGLLDLGTLGGPISRAIGINSNGAIVGASSTAAGESDFHAFLWTRAHGMIDLNARLKHAPPGLVLTDAVAISDTGAIVADSNAGLVLLKPGVHGTDAPVVGPILPGDPIAVGTRIAFSANFTDQNSADTHKANWSWGDRCGSGSGSVTESNGAGSARASHAFCQAGVYSVTLTVKDNTGRSSTVARDVVVYDPAAPAVAGGGWFMSPQGAYGKDKVHAGRATFSFVSKATRDSTARRRDLSLKFHVANLYFQSAAYDALSVAGTRAQYQGSGTVNGAGNYKFLMTAVDGSGDKSAGPSRLRMKIWHTDARTNAEVVDYDNQVGASASTLAAASEGSAIGAGSIAIRK